MVLSDVKSKSNKIKKNRIPKAKCGWIGSLKARLIIAQNLPRQKHD
jgi:hypothetical protein